MEISKKISIHALREEGDDPRHRRRHHDQNFYPRPPRGGRPTNQTAGATSPGFLSTPSARRATKAASMPRNNFRFLSTPSARRATSTHSLCDPADDLFLSTPSARRATSKSCAGIAPSGYFYPRPPRGGRPAPPSVRSPSSSDFYPRPPRGGRLGRQQLYPDLLPISIHALRKEGDQVTLSTPSLAKQFLSTPSARRATTPLCSRSAFLSISIHALREEGDRSPRCSSWWITAFLSTPSARRATRDRQLSRRNQTDFYPRPPRGGRPGLDGAVARHAVFLSTPSARRAT